MRIKIIAILCYILGLGGSAAFVARVLALGVGVDWQPFSLPPPWPWLVNVGWLFVFALQHSGMAREASKRGGRSLCQSLWSARFTPRFPACLCWEWP